MNIEIFQIDKTRNPAIAALESHYAKLIQPYARISNTIFRPHQTGSQPDKKQIVAVEGQSLRKALPAGSYIIALSESGTQLSSIEFSRHLSGLTSHGKSRFTFVIGGAFGLSDEVIQKANFVLSLSRMTFTHEMVRAILLEQLYRACTIIKGKTYHY